MKAVVAALIALSPSLALAQAPLELNLVCTGKLATMEQRTTTGTVTNPQDATQNATVRAHSWDVVHEDARMFVSLRDGAAKVRPGWSGTFRMKTEDGWFAVDKLEVGDDEIRGHVKLGLLGGHRLRIDRRTGEIRFGDFKGDCEKTEVAPDTRKF